jgi:hypothetical protein
VGWPATYGDLLADVASGKVDDVQVLGADTPAPTSHGYDAWEAPVIVTDDDPRETLRSITSGMQITKGSSLGDSSFSSWSGGHRGAVVLALLTWLAVLFLTGPLGSVAYLLLGGPLSAGRPRAPHRRLTGGWAFLLAMVVFGGSNAA